jgi:hypothetical protein
MIAIYLLTTALLAGPAVQGDDPLSLLGRTELRCPACRKTFTTIICVQSNTRCGVDRDLFSRSLGPQPEFYRISTCPKCGYSGYLSDFDPDLTLSPDVRERILNSPGLKLPAGFGPASDPQDLNAAARYSLAISCYQWRQRSDEALAWLCLRASWVEREEGSSLPADPRLRRVLNYLERWRPPLLGSQNQLDVEMQLAARTAEAVAAGRFNRYQRPYVDLALALMLRRHGENSQATAILDRLAKSSPDAFSQALRESMAAMQQSIGREQQYQRQAADAFERAFLANQLTADNRAPAMYLLAELCRRLGRDAEATRWFDRTLQEPALPPDLRTWTNEQRILCLPPLRPR